MITLLTDLIQVSQFNFTSLNLSLSYIPQASMGRLLFGVKRIKVILGIEIRAFYEH